VIAPPSGNRFRLKKWAIGFFSILILLPLILSGVLAYALQSEQGTQGIWHFATWALQGRLSGNVSASTLMQGVQMRNIVYRDHDLHIVIDRLDTQWAFSHSPFAWTVDYMRFGTVEVHLPLATPPSAPFILPQNLRLPLTVTLKELALQKLIVKKQAIVTELDDLLLTAESSPLQHTLVLQKIGTPYGTGNATLHVGSLKPFIVSGGFELKGVYQKERYQIDGHLAGTLTALALQFTAVGDRLGGSGQVDATPFAPVPLQRAQISIAHVNPKMFSASLPQADLNVQATLTPVTDHAGILTVSGPITVTNTQPGALDRDRLPLISANANVRLDAQRQQLSQIKVKLTNTALIQGQGELNRHGKGEFTFEIEELDLHAIHGRLKPSRLRGPLAIRLAAGTQDFSMQLADGIYKIEADAGIDTEKFSLRMVQLTAGSAQLALKGELKRDPQSAYAFQGKLSNFNPALWMNNTDKKPGTSSLQGNINADVDVNGMLVAELQARLTFALRDSTYDHLPLTGNGSIQIAGNRLLPSDAQLLIAGNQLMLKGSFGTVKDRLNVKVNAPQLQRLGFGLSGVVQLDGDVTGTLKEPNVHISYRVEQLVFGAYRLATMSGQADVKAQPDAGMAATHLAVSLNAQGYQEPGMTLNSLAANINGTYGSHVFDLRSAGLLRGKPLELKIAAQGKLNEKNGQYGWDGSIRTVENQGTPRFVLEAPVTLSVGPDRIAAGPTRMTFANALIDLKNFSYEAGRIRSAGAVSALDIGHLLELQHEFTGIEVPLKTNLVLDGIWDFILADTASGFAQMTRRQGDVTVNSGRGEVQLGLSGLFMRANLDANRIKVNAEVTTARIGTVKLEGQIVLQRQDGRLLVTQDAPVSAHATAVVPQLKSVGALIGPQVALDGVIGMDLVVGGTVGHPIWSGNIAGDKLAFTLFDQGIALHDGIVRISLKENVVELNRIEFHGGEGTLKASGQVQLDQSNPALVTSIIADRLQLFASPDQQLTLSGQANVSNDLNRFQVKGAFTVDRGLFDLPKSNAPRLGDDVVIVQRNSRGKIQVAAVKPQERFAKVSEKPAGRFSPYVDINVDLGQNFRFRGASADLLLAGSMSVHAEPYLPLQATGTVNVVEGTYEVFGRKLAIEQGLINFQGPLDNPNMTILAMRRNQEVEAGVQVTGNVRRPRVRLVSEPTVADEEKLSWLMFGHGSDTSVLGQQQAVGAAFALLGNAGGKRIAQGIGLDEFSVGASESGLNDQQVLNLGKSISDRFYLGYEQSLAGAASIVKITWQWSRRWSLVARGGAINSLDVLFNRRFD
jgi:translocation and assembly module TamB